MDLPRRIRRKSEFLFFEYVAGPSRIWRSAQGHCRSKLADVKRQCAVDQRSPEMRHDAISARRERPYVFASETVSSVSELGPLPRRTNRILQPPSLEHARSP